MANTVFRWSGLVNAYLGLLLPLALVWIGVAMLPGASVPQAVGTIAE